MRTKTKANYIYMYKDGYIKTKNRYDELVSVRGQRHHYFLIKMVYCSGGGFELLSACVVFADWNLGTPQQQHAHFFSPETCN